MLRDILFSRAILVGIVCFVLIVGGTQFYRWQVLRKPDIVFDLERPDQLLRGLEKQNETRPSPMVNVPTEKKTPGFEDTPTENTSTWMSQETDAETLDDTENLDIADAFLPDEMGSEEKAPADFPETPEGYPMTPVWDDDRFPNYQKGDMPDHEIIDRVLIKLWNQGDHGFINGYLDFDNGRVYPLYPDTLYVTWKEEVVDSPDGPRTIRYPGIGVGTHDRRFTPEELYFYGVEASYPDINFVDKHTAGYDPETFLTDDEK